MRVAGMVDSLELVCVGEPALDELHLVDGSVVMQPGGAMANTAFVYACGAIVVQRVGAQFLFSLKDVELLQGRK